MDIYVPPTVEVKFATSPFRTAVAKARLLSYDKLPGEAVGSATVEFSESTATDFNPTMGTLADIYCGGAKVFAGYVVDAPADISADSDVSQIVLADIKGLLRGRFIGEDGVGSLEGGGFPQVGYLCVFNWGGYPDRLADANAWGGTTAWRCIDIINWIFTHYVPVALAVPGGQELDGGWLREPADLDLTGMTVLAALDRVAQLAGESWDLRPQKSGAAIWTRIAPGKGDLKTVRLFQPGRNAQAADAGEYHATAVSIRPSVAGSFDLAEAQSSPGVVETLFGTDETRGASILKRSAPADTQYAMRYQVQVDTYADRNAGLSLLAGSRPKAIMPWLVTRVSPAGAVVSPPYTSAQERMPGPIVWIVTDNTDAGCKPRRVNDGFRIDLDWGTIDCEEMLSLVDPVSGQVSQVQITDWTKVDLYLTAAVRVEDRQVEQSEAATGLPLTQKCLVARPDLVPEWRWQSAIPASNAAGWQVVSDGDDPVLCVDVSADLASAAAAALASMPAPQYNGRIAFATVPAIYPGDRVAIVGRTLPTGSAALSVVDVRMSCVDGVPDEIELNVSNAPVASDPQSYLSSRRPS